MNCRRSPGYVAGLHQLNSDTQRSTVVMNRRTKNRMICTATQAARRRRRRAAAAAALVGAAMAASAFDARVEASTRSWKSTAPAWSSWNIGGNWTPLGQPLDGDSAMIVNTAATE